ncbi:hypothetical protein [Carnobacterium gallinarum]|uniref:hypothetical protein n=1 Tax=Carnobacterium gallinarum TaxID=2749 RepID=UPI00054E1200|nr:hypothetical protein [Carnobacterium gallinarum]
MYFQTVEYKEKRDAYESLETKLATRFDNQTNYLKAIQSMVSNVNKMNFSAESEGLPNQDSVDKFMELNGELSSLVDVQHRQAESLYYASTVAREKYEEYSGLYQAEKKREEDYNAEEARKAEEKKREEREKMN